MHTVGGAGARCMHGSWVSGVQVSLASSSLLSRGRGPPLQGHADEPPDVPLETDETDFVLPLAMQGFGCSCCCIPGFIAVFASYVWALMQNVNSGCWPHMQVGSLKAP